MPCKALKASYQYGCPQEPREEGKIGEGTKLRQEDEKMNEIRPVCILISNLSLWEIAKSIGRGVGLRN